MAYTPENNPYIPGDPYSYDLKWMVKKINEWKDPLDSAERAKASEEAAAASAEAAELSAQDSADSAATAKNYADNIADPVSGIVTDWLADNITQPTTPAIDTSLTIAGAAADAKAVGDRLADVGISNRVFKHNDSGQMYDASGNIVLESSNPDFIFLEAPVNEGDVFNYSDTYGTGHYSHYYNELDAAGNVLFTMLVSLTSGTFEKIIGKGCTKILFNIFNDTNVIKANFNRSNSPLVPENYTGQMYDYTMTLISPNPSNGLIFLKFDNISNAKAFALKETLGTYKTHFFNSYDASDNLLEYRLTYSVDGVLKTPVAPNAAYIIVSAWLSNSDQKYWIPDYTMISYGDSIVEGVMSLPGGTNTQSSFNGYIGLTEHDNENIAIINEGDATGGVVAIGNNGLNGCQIIDATNSDDLSRADIITIAYGVNDYLQNKPLGDATSTANDGSVSGNIRYMIEKAYTMNPDACVVVFTPCNTARVGSASSKYAINYANSAGYTLNDVADIMKYWAGVYNVNVVDWTNANPIINMLNILDVLLDDLHPSDAGYHHLARAFTQALPFTI